MSALLPATSLGFVGASAADSFASDDTGNRRREKTVYDPGSGGVVAQTAYFYLGFRCVEEQEAGSGTTLVTYAWGPRYIDELCEFERTAAHPLGAGRFWVHQDARFDVVAITDASGAVVERRFYDDFGQPLNA